MPQPPPVEQAEWFYSVNGSRRGPVTTAQLKTLVESGMLRATDLLWREGLPAWVEAGTIPELFPAGALVKPPPQPPAVAPLPVPVPEARPTAQPVDEETRSSRDDQRAVHVHVNQVIERVEEERPRRRSRGYRCPYCGSSARPFYRTQVSSAGWVVFVLLLIFTIIFCFIGLLMTEAVPYCPDCGARL